MMLSRPCKQASGLFKFEKCDAMSRAVDIKLPKQKVASSNLVSRSIFEFEFSKTNCVLRKSC